MNERKFLKQLNNEDNKDGSLTCAIVSNLINLQRKKRILQKTSKIRKVFGKLFSNYKKEKTAEQIIKDNFPEILEKTISCNLDILITRLTVDSETKDIITDNLNIILNRLVRDDAFQECNSEAFDRIIELPEGKEFIEQNIDNMLDNISPRSVFQISQYLKGLSDGVDKKLNIALEKNKLEMAKALLDDCTATRTVIENKEEVLDEYKLTLSVMIDELLESENCRYIDIKYLSRGAYSDVYQIGDKVIKIGGPRQTYSMPNHRRILQPLTRTNFIDEKYGNKPFACIEISDKVDPLLAEDIRDENLYKIYKDLREDGIIWTDIRFANVGKLNKRNIPSLNKEDINVAPNSVGFTNDKDEKTLSAGDLVILDTDYIYSKEDDNIIWQYGYSQEFEKRYQQEKSDEIAKRYNSKETVEKKTIKEEQR